MASRTWQTLYHVTLHRFHKAASAEVARKLKNTPGCSLAQCLYQEDGDMFVITCPSGLGEQCLAALCTIVARYVDEETTRAQNTKTSPHVTRFPESIAIKAGLRADDSNDAEWDLGEASDNGCQSGTTNDLSTSEEHREPQLHWSPNEHVNVAKLANREILDKLAELTGCQFKIDTIENEILIFGNYDQNINDAWERLTVLQEEFTRKTITAHVIRPTIGGEAKYKFIPLQDVGGGAVGRALPPPRSGKSKDSYIADLLVCIAIRPTGDEGTYKARRRRIEALDAPEAPGFWTDMPVQDFGQDPAVENASAIPNSAGVPPFGGDPNNVEQWRKTIETPTPMSLPNTPSATPQKESVQKGPSTPGRQNESPIKKPFPWGKILQSSEMPAAAAAVVGHTSSFEDSPAKPFSTTNPWGVQENKQRPQSVSRDSPGLRHRAELGRGRNRGDFRRGRSPGRGYNNQRGNTTPSRNPTVARGPGRAHRGQNVQHPGRVFQPRGQDFPRRAQGFPRCAQGLPRRAQGFPLRAQGSQPHGGGFQPRARAYQHHGRGGRDLRENHGGDVNPIVTELINFDDPSGTETTNLVEPPPGYGVDFSSPGMNEENQQLGYIEQPPEDVLDNPEFEFEESDEVSNTPVYNTMVLQKPAPKPSSALANLKDDFFKDNPPFEPKLNTVKTSNTNKAATAEAEKVTGTKPELVAPNVFSKIVKEAFEQNARTFRGKVELHMQIGQVLISLSGNRKKWLMDEHDETSDLVDTLASIGPLDNAFTQRITTSGSDMAAVLDMLNIDHGPDEEELYWEITCQDPSGKDTRIHLDATNKSEAFALSGEETLGECYYHFPDNVWDARCVVSGTNIFPDVSEVEGIKELVDSIFTRTEEQDGVLAPRLSGRDGYQHATDVCLKKRMRYLAPSNFAGNHCLQFTRVQQLEIERHTNVVGAFRATLVNENRMLSEHRVWYEISIAQINQPGGLLENVDLRLGEKATWNVEDIVDEKSLTDMEAFMAHLDQNMNDVGAKNRGPAFDWETRKREKAAARKLEVQNRPDTTEWDRAAR